MHIMLLWKGNHSGETLGKVTQMLTAPALLAEIYWELRENILALKIPLSRDNKPHSARTNGQPDCQQHLTYLLDSTWSSQDAREPPSPPRHTSDNKEDYGGLMFSLQGGTRGLPVHDVFCISRKQAAVNSLVFSMTCFTHPRLSKHLSYG